MTQTENISLGGYSFTIGKEALAVLEEYLSKVEASSSADVKDELVSDIEERLAELFIEKCGKNTVLDVDSVKSVIDIIGVPESDESENPSLEGSSSESSKESPRTHRRIYRNMNGRLLGGVCSGIATYFGLDVTLIRLALALFCFISIIGHFPHSCGFIVLAYFIAWAIMPAPKSVEEQCEFEGKPLRFDDFKDRAESLKDTVKDSAERISEEVKTAPIGHVLARGISVSVGVLLTLIGIAALLVVLFFAIDFPLDRINFETLRIAEMDKAFIQEYLSVDSIRYAIFAVIGIFGLGQLYEGIRLIFDLKNPSWKPGLIIFILWCVAIIVLALLLTKNALLFNDIILTV